MGSAYPYTSSESTCAKSGKTRVFPITSPGWSQVTSSYSAFKAALRSEPINISFAVGDDFMYYSSGIYEDSSA